MPPEGLSEQLELLPRMPSPSPSSPQPVGKVPLARHPAAVPLGSMDVPVGFAWAPEQKYQRSKPQAELWQGHLCLLLLCFQPLLSTSHGPRPG